jgi:hypothetical protein
MSVTSGAILHIRIAFYPANKNVDYFLSEVFPGKSQRQTLIAEAV